MQVFISWSGPQARGVATALRTWLPKVLDDKVTPFVSADDIDKGDRGLNRIAAELETSGYGILVVTPSNQNSPWMNFEAGALGKSVQDGRVAPLLVGLSDSDVTGPIKQFQNTESSDREAVLALIRSLNQALPEPMGSRALEVLFTEYWPELEAAICKVPSDTAAKKSEPKRSDTDLLEEVLVTVRSLQRDVARLRRQSGRGFDGDSGRRFDGEYGNPVDHLFSRAMDLLHEEIGVMPTGGSHTEAGLSIQLPEGTPLIHPEAQIQLQKLVTATDVPMALLRDNGAKLMFTPGGDGPRIVQMKSKADRSART